MKTRLFEPIGGEPANGSGVETLGDDIYAPSTEIDTTSETQTEVGETDIAQTQRTSEQVDKNAANQQDEGDVNASPAAQTTVAAKPAVAQPTEEERIAKIAAAVVNAGRAPTQEQQQQVPELTQAQIRQLLNPVEVTPDVLRAFGIENASPEQVAAYQQFANSIVRNASSVANLVIEQKLRESLSPYQPYVNFIEQQQAKQHVDTFYSKHGELQKYEKFVQLAAQSISPVKADKTMKSANEVYDEVASSVKAMLAEAGVTIASPSANPSAVVNKGSAVPRMASLASTGRSQGGQPSGEQNNPDADIYS